MKTSRKKKFNKRAFRRWLDVLCKVVVKARDEYTCQKCHKRIADVYDCQWCHVKSRKSNQFRWSLHNTLTLCGSCHARGHDNVDEFVKWFARVFPARHLMNSQPYKTKTWREEDYLAVEALLIGKAIDFEVDVCRVPEQYKVRFMKCFEKGMER